MSPSTPFRHNAAGTEDGSVLGAARQAFLGAVRDAFGVMLGKLDDALFDLAQSSDDELERGNYFDAIRELRLGRETIETRFLDKLSACWDALERGDGPAERHVGGVDQNEVIALTAAVRWAEAECADALRGVRDGLALAVGAPAGDELVGPRQVFAAFEAACRDTPADPAVRLIVLKFFERHVGTVLPRMYRDLAVALVDPAAEPGTSPVQVDLPPLQGQALPGDERVAVGEIDLSDLIQNALAGGGQKGEVLKLLATLQQHDRPGSRSRSASIDLARVASSSAGGDLSPQVVLDMVALLFDAVFTDDAVPVSARLQIARLQIPFLRLALRDRGMLARRTHLGRRFFDQLIAVTRSWHEPLTTQQQQVLCSMVDSFTEACMDDQRTFAATAENSLADLRGLALPAPVSEEIGQSHRKSLAAHADKELADRRRRVGRLPDPVDAFLQTHWRQYLVDCLQRYGMDSSPWWQALATVDALLWSVSPKEGAASQRLAELRPRMTRRIRQGMDQVCVSMFEQEAFLEVLDEILDRAQAGERVWDWEGESEIEALLGAEDLSEPAADAVTVVEIDAPSQAKVGGQAANEDAAEPSGASLPDAPEGGAPPDEQAPSVDDGRALHDPMGPATTPHEADAVDVDALPGELDEVAPMQPPVTGAEGTAEGPAQDVDVSEPAWTHSSQDEGEGERDFGTPPDVADAPSDETPENTPSGEAPPEDATSLEALLRRRGLSIASHVEEVEVTERGSRS
ncbi:MAG TPA: hypothetical protein DIT63_10455 [Gammaproteobacteria bacterium]|nr:hypothetical protein [Gammaproteobacteria bacterium]